MNEKMCRLCLQTINGNYETIGQSLINSFKLKLNMDITDEALRCIECTNNLEVLSKFNSACDYIKQQPTELEDDVNLKSENTEITDHFKSIVGSKNEIRCCFCTKASEREGLTSLNESKEHAFLMNVLKEYIPKLNITEELLVCEICLDELQEVFRFVTNCMDVEEKISKYREIKGTDGKSKIDLKDVQQFIFDPVVKYEIESRGENEYEERGDQLQEGCTIAAEAEIKYENEMDSPELFHKTEEVYIKSEHNDYDSCQEQSAITEVEEDISVRKSNGEHTEFIDQHMLTYKDSDGKTVYKCETCAYETKRRNNLKHHKLTHKSISELTVFKCDQCSYVGKRRDCLKQHKLIHKSSSDVTMFKCELCPYETKWRAGLKQHQLTHKTDSELTTFKCDQCSYEGKRRDHLKQHKLIHNSASDVTMFKCDLCTYETRWQANLKRHNLGHKSTSELTMFKCDLCSYEGKCKDYLDKHKLIHSSTLESTAFKCNQCSYVGKLREDLIRHKLTHESSSDGTVFKCDLCPYETRWHTSLKRHKLAHKSTSELTMFKCDLCSYKAKSKCFVNRHKLIHMRENVGIILNNRN